MPFQFSVLGVNKSRDIVQSLRQHKFSLKPHYQYGPLITQTGIKLCVSGTVCGTQLQLIPLRTRTQCGQQTIYWRLHAQYM